MAINRESKVISLMRIAKVRYSQTHGQEMGYLVPQTKFEKQSEAGKFNNVFFGSFFNEQKLKDETDPTKRSKIRTDYYAAQYKQSAASFEASKSPTGYIEFEVLAEREDDHSQSENVIVRFSKDKATFFLDGDEIELRGGANNFGCEETREESTLRAKLDKEIMREKIYGEHGKPVPKEDFAIAGAPAPVKKQFDTGADLIY